MMQNCIGMGDEIQSQLGRRIEEVAKAVETTTGKRVREVKVTQAGGVNAIINDERYLHENSWLFEDPNSVVGFNDSNKLHESHKEIGKLIKRLNDIQKNVEEEEKENIMLRESEKTAQRRTEEAEKQVAKLREADEKKQDEMKILQNEIKNLRSAISKKEEKFMKLEKHNAKAFE